MSESPKRPAGSSRRNFLKATAGVTAGTILTRPRLWAQSSRASAAAVARSSPAFPKINPQFMITPDQAWDWNVFKAKGGPTYAGSTGWKRFTDFLISKMPEFGGVDLDYVEIPYDHYIVDDWPDRRTHVHDSGVALEKLVTDGTPVPVVASYGMTSGFTPAEGVTAPMLYYDPAHPPAAGHRGEDSRLPDCALPKPAVQQFVPGQLHADRLRVAVPGPVGAAVYTSADQRHKLLSLPLGLESAERIRRDRRQRTRRGHRRRLRLSPGAAFGLAQRSVYTPDAKAGLGASYVNCPTLTLDRVNGTKVLADAKAGRTATLTLTARFQRDTGKAIIAYLPGRNYGTPQDEQVLVATHTDAMSLIEENGGLGVLGIMSYFNRLPRASRPRTLVLYFDCRHFMPGAETGWPQFDYYAMHPERLKPIVATLGIEHMGGPTDDRSRARWQPVRVLARAPGKWRRHHEPDGRLQQQHLARRSDCESGDR